MGNVVPKPDVWFVRACDYNYQGGLAAHVPARWGRSSWKAEQMHLNIRPALAFRAANIAAPLILTQYLTLTSMI